MLSGFFCLEFFPVFSVSGRVNRHPSEINENSRSRQNQNSTFERKKPSSHFARISVSVHSTQKILPDNMQTAVSHIWEGELMIWRVNPHTHTHTLTHNLGHYVTCKAFPGEGAQVRPKADAPLSFIGHRV